MANATSYRCAGFVKGGPALCENGLLVRRDVVEPILLRGVKRDLLSDGALAEFRKDAAEAQRGKKSHRSAIERELREVTKQVARVVDGIATCGVSTALRDKLLVLERQRDDLERQVRVADAAPIEMTAGLIDRWRDLVDGLERLSMRPGAWPEDVDESRERLAGIIGNVRMIPEAGQLVAEVGFSALPPRRDAVYTAVNGDAFPVEGARR